jgi:cytochrome d ubiquinol oxidase subunit II
MILYWSLVLALSMLLYVLLDGFDLGVDLLSGLTRDEARRHHMLASVSPLWDGNETWLIVAGVVLWGAFSPAYSLLMSAFYVPVTLMLAGLIFRAASPSSSVNALAVRAWSGQLAFHSSSAKAGATLAPRSRHGTTRHFDKPRIT